MLNLIPWGRPLLYTLIATLVAGPYIALFHYTPKYLATQAVLDTAQEQLAVQTRRVAELQALQSAWAAALETLRLSTDKAAAQRKVTGAELALKLPAREANLSALNLQLKVPTNETSKCAALANLIDDYALGELGSVRRTTRPASN